MKRHRIWINPSNLKMRPRPCMMAKNSYYYRRTYLTGAKGSWAVVVRELGQDAEAQLGRSSGYLISPQMGSDSIGINTPLFEP